jgi:hypothetical protein
METTKVIVEKINTDTVEIIGKTFDSATYSGDVNSREKIVGQTFITADDVGDNMTVRGEGNDTPIRKVEAVDKVEVRVQLLNAESLDDGKSLASVFLRGVWKAKGIENPDMDEIFVMYGTNEDALAELRHISIAMGATTTGARTLGKWYPAVDGKRVIIRMVGGINKSGKINQAGLNPPEKQSDGATIPF